MEKPNTEKPARMKRCYCPVVKTDATGKIVGMVITIPNGTSVYPLYHFEELADGTLQYVPMKIAGP
jgi:hypothetical protein